MEPFVRLRSLLTDRCFTVVKLTGFERLNLFQVTAYFFLCYISSLTVIKGIVYCLIVRFSCYSFIVLLVFSCIPSVYAFAFLLSSISLSSSLSHILVSPIFVFVPLVPSLFPFFLLSPLFLSTVLYVFVDFAFIFIYSYIHSLNLVHLFLSFQKCLLFAAHFIYSHFMIASSLGRIFLYCSVYIMYISRVNRKL